jgi:TRAP-type mannitol/chloroaromatic compound transport system substrate-binding protein
LQQVPKFNVVSFFHGLMPTQLMGWFAKDVKGPEDLKDVRFRTVGLSATLFGEMGAAVKILPGGEIIPRHGTRCSRCCRVQQHYLR